MDYSRIKTISLTLMLIVSGGAFGQDLTISSSGQTGTSGTNWSISGNTLTVSGTANVNASVIENHLNGGNDLHVDVSTGSVTCLQNIAYTGATTQTLTVNTKRTQTWNGTVSATGSGALNLVLGSNNNGNSGPININQNISTNGGHFFIAGGWTSSGTTTWNGLTVPSGQANNYTAGEEGINVSSCAINTNGGDLLFKGRSYYSGSTPSEEYGIYLNSCTITTGAGNQEYVGDITGVINNGSGVRVSSNSAAVNLETTSGTITITGTGDDSNSGGQWRHGVILWPNVISSDVTIKTVSGAISITGTANYTNLTSTDQVGVQLFSPVLGSSLNIVSQTGAISITGSNTQEADGQEANGIRFHAMNEANSMRIGYDGTNAYSGNITISSNSIWQTNDNATAGNIAIRSTGNIAVQPTGTSFTYLRKISNGTLTWEDDWNFGTGAGALTIGKSGNTFDLELDNNLTATGDITIYGGNLVLDANLSTTGSGSQIRLLATSDIKSNTQTNLEFTTGSSTVTGGGIDFFADVDGNSSGQIRLTTGTTFQSWGGDITLAGGNANGTGYAHGYSTTYSEGVRLDKTVTINSNNGDIVMRGKSAAVSPPSGYGAWGVGTWDQGHKSIDAGTGTVYIEGVAQTNGGWDPGVLFADGSVGSGNYMTITSANTTANAIQIIGSADYGNGIQTTMLGGLKVHATGTNGGITMEGDGAVRNFHLETVNEILAASGPITLEGKTSNQLFLNTGCDLDVGAKAGTSITSSSSDITFKFDSYYYNNHYPAILTTGSVTVEPITTSTSFSQKIESHWWTWNNSGDLISGLTFGKSGNNAEIELDAVQNVAGPITAYGSIIDVDANLTSSAAGDILFKAISGGNEDVNIASNVTITKTGGAGTFTVQTHGRIQNWGTTTASGAGSLNVILWSDYDGDDLDGGVSPSGTLITNGGHVWIGGGKTSGGSSTWNSLTVGDGGSVATSGHNHHSVDLYGSITTNGGDVLVWADAGYGTDQIVVSDSYGSAISTGSGDVTLIADYINGGGANSLTVNSTGHITLAPNGGSYPAALTVAHNSATNWNFSGSNYNYLFFYNGNSIGGFTVGEYTGMNGVSITNSSDITLSSPVTAAGDIAFFGGDITLNGDQTSSTSGDILIKASGTISQFADATSDGGNIVLWSDSDANGDGRIGLTNNTTHSSGGGHIVFAGGADSDSDGLPDGYAISTSTHGLHMGTLVSSSITLSSSGGDISLKGKSTSTTHSTGHGVYGQGGFSINAGSGGITIDGVSGNFYGVDFGGSAGTSDPAVTMTSSKSTGDAISITGLTTGTIKHGIALRGDNAKTLSATGAGNISLTGTGTNTFYGLWLDNVDVLANSGDITLDGGTKGIRIAGKGARFGAKAGTAVTSSSSNVLLKSDLFRISDFHSGYSTTFLTSGTLTFKSSDASKEIVWPSGTATSGWDWGRSSGSSYLDMTWESI